MGKPRITMYDSQETQILEKTAAFAELLTRKGILEDTEITKAKRRKAQRTTAKKAYHNTNVVLSHYRTIVWVLECFPGEIAQELAVKTKEIDALISRVDYEIVMENKRLEDRLHAMYKTRYLLDRINEALMVVKQKPGNGEQLYKLIYEAFVDPEERPVTELIERMMVSTRTYYRMKSEALAIISIRLWSAPSREIDDWIEILTILEDM